MNKFQMTEEELLKFFSRVKLWPNGCWRWTGGIFHSGGYARFYFRKKFARASRISYMHFVGPIPHGMHIDHVVERGCYFRDCVNPFHLEAVTPTENTRRGDARQLFIKNVSSKISARTHCPKGHPLSGENLYVDPRNHRGCKTCRRESVRKCRRDSERAPRD